MNSLIYNKALLKTIYNNLLLYEGVSRKFTTKFDALGFANYIGFTYLTETEIKDLKYDISNNHYIGVNEIVLTSTVNRCLEQVYNLQLKIQSNIQEKSINVFPLLTQVVPLDI